MADQKNRVPGASLKLEAALCVAAVLLAGCSEPASKETAVSSPVPNVAMPEAAGSQITLAWDAVAGAASYRVYYGPILGSRDQRLDVELVTTATIPDVGTAKFFYVTALDSAGMESMPSNWVAMPSGGSPTPARSPARSPSPTITPGPTVPPTPAPSATATFTPAKTPTPSPTASKTPSPSPTPSTLSLGIFTLEGAASGSCPPGFKCNNFTVSKSGIADAPGVIAIWPVSGTAVGTVVLLSGGQGTALWSSVTGDSTLTTPFLQSLHDAGYALVQARWKGQGWLASSPGDPSGFVKLGCRPATLIKYVHDIFPRGSFVITGNSGGASQVAYALGYPISVDVAIATSGPPMMQLTKGCTNGLGYAYAPGDLFLIDYAWGYSQPAGGPCKAHDASFAATWNANSVEAITTHFPSTRFCVLSGGRDSAIIVNRANDYFHLLVANGQTNITRQIVTTMAHEIAASSDGLAALFTAITATSPSPTPARTPPRPTATPTATVKATATPTTTNSTP